MKGNIRFPIGNGIACNDVAGTAAYVVLRTWNVNNSTRMYVGTVNFPTYISSTASDLIHDRNGSSYLLWDSFNLKDPATLSGNNTFTGNNTFQAGKFNVGPFEVTSSGSLLLNISSPAGSTWSRNLVFKANSDITSSIVFGGYNSIDDISIGYAYIGTGGDINYQTAQYRFYSNRLEVPKIWRLIAGSDNILNVNIENNFISLGSNSSTSYIISNDSDLKHRRFTTTSAYKDYIVWDSYNLPTPANTTDLANYLPLIGGTLTGQLTIKQSVDIKLRLQSTDADNHCIIQAINSQASQLGVFGYAGDKWAIGHNGTYYEIWDKYNLTNPVTYTTNTYNHATLTNKDGQYFTYIKAGTNGLLPHSKATLVSGGSGSLGTSDQSFNAAYINNLHTNKVTFGDAGSFIDNQSGDSSHRGIGFYTSQNAACPVYVGSLCVSDSYANGAPNIPATGIYSEGNIRTSGWISFTNNAWTNEGGAYKEEDGSLKVLIVPTDNSQPKPSYYGNVLQFNSRKNHWCTQIWSDQVNSTANPSNGKLRYRTTQSYATTTWNPWTVIATEDYVSSNYLPLTGGILTGSSSRVLGIDFSGGSETFIRVLRNGEQQAAIGFMDGLGAYIYNYNSSKYLFIDNNGDARVGTTNSSTRLALITDIPTVSGYLPLSGGTMTGALTMSSRRNNVVVDVVGGAGQSWNEGAGALSVQVPSDSGQTPLLLARRSGATINTTTLSERLLDMALLDTGTIFKVGMSGVNALELEVTSFTNKVGIGKLFGKTIATTDQIPSIPSISISNSGSGNAVTAISASGHTLTVTKGATYLTSSSLDGYATQTWVNNKGYLTSHQTIYNLTFQAGTFAAKTFDPNGAAATVNIPTKTSHITNDSGFITSSALNGYATQAWVNSQNFVKSTSTKKVTDIQPVDALPATQASGVLYLVFG